MILLLVRLWNKGCTLEKYVTRISVPQWIPVDKKNRWERLLNFRPVSILSSLSQVYKSILKTELVEKINSLFSLFFLRIENLTARSCKRLGQYFVEAVPMDLSIAFHCTPHVLVIANLAAYEFDHTWFSLVIPEKCKTMCHCQQY